MRGSSRSTTAGDTDQLPAEFQLSSPADGLFLLGQIQGKEEERRQLADKGLGGGHADLRAGMGVDRAVGLSGHGRTDHVADGDDFCSHLLGDADAGQGVGGLPRLGDGDGQHPLVDEQMPVAEFRGDIHLDRDMRIFFDPVFGDQGGMPGGAAGDQEDPVDFCTDRRR